MPAPWPFCYLCNQPAVGRVWVCETCVQRWHLPIDGWEGFYRLPRRMTLSAPNEIPEAYKRFALDTCYLLDEGL